MGLKDLVVDQETIEEELIENLVSPHVRYDPKQSLIVFIDTGPSSLDVSQKIVLYLLALKGWKFIEGGKNIASKATPKQMSESIGENGSTVRNHLQTLKRDGVVYKTASGEYTILPQSVHKIRKFLEVN